MKNYVFLTNYYLPSPGATGMCVHRLAVELAKKHNVFTICYENNSDVNLIENVSIIKIKLPRYLKENTDSSSYLSLKIKQIESLSRKLFHIRKYPLRSNNLVKQYINKAEKLIKEFGEVCVIASYTPLEAVVAAYELKTKYPEQVKIVYYSADTLSNEMGDSGLLSANYRSKCGFRWEKKLFELFDLILIMECHKEHYYSTGYFDFRKKMRLVNFPLLLKPSYKKTEFMDQTSQMVYAGTLYRELRNPQFLCNCLVEVCKKINIEVSFLGGGDCDDIIENASDTTNGKIKRYGMKPHSVVMDYLANATLLLSIGNKESPMAPSKIYEYMSTGKPIIHVYTYDKDPCNEPLKKYGNALLIKEGDDLAVDKMIDFINSSRIISFSEVSSKFPTSTPKYSTDFIENL